MKRSKSCFQTGLVLAEFRLAISLSSGLKDTSNAGKILLIIFTQTHLKKGQGQTFSKSSIKIS